MIAKEGIPFVIGALAIFLLLVIFPVKLIIFVSALFCAFCIWFFRDPERTIPPESDVLVSPADGKVIEVMSVEYQGEMRTKVSIFMNIFNVHVNRMPITGTITSVTHVDGKFLPADRPDASYENEQNVIEIESAAGSITVKQIAGLIARRTVCYPSAGDTLPIGDRLGIIKFSSRLEVFIPKGFDISVKNGDSVTAGESVLARFIGA